MSRPRQYTMSHVARARRLAMQAAGALVAVLLTTEQLRAQHCGAGQVRDPECAPLHAPRALLSPHTTSTTVKDGVKLFMEVTDEVAIQQPGAGSVLTKVVNGSATPVSVSLTWDLRSGRGWQWAPLTAGLNVFVLTATNSQGQTATDTAKITYTPPPTQSPPSFNVTGWQSLHHSDVRQGEPCAGCSATFGYATPAYFSLDQPRSLALAYSSAAAAPTGYLLMTVQSLSTDTVRAYSVRLRQQGTSTYQTFLNDSTQVFFQPTAGAYAGTTTLAVQFDARTLTTGPHRYVVEVRSFYSTAPGTSGYAAQDDVTVLVNNQKDSPLGRGVSWANVPRLMYDATSLWIVYGDGAIINYAQGSWNSDSSWFNSPPGVSRSVTWITALNGFRAVDPDGSFMIFDYYGYLTAAGNRFGDTTRYTWDNTTHLLKSVRDPTGTSIGVTYAGSGVAALRTITDSAGLRTSTMAYDASGRLTSIQQPDGNYAVQGVTYDSLHRVMILPSPLGGMRLYAYSAAGWVRSVKDSIAGRQDSLLTTVSPALDTMSAPKGSGIALSNRWSPGPNETQIKSPLGVRTATAVDRFGQLMDATVTDPAGNTQITHVTRDSLGRVTSQTGPTLRPTFYTYSGANLATVTDAGGTTRYTWTTFAQPESVWVNERLVARYHYTGATATLDTLRSDSVTISRFTWDAHGRLKTSVNPLGATTTYGYATSGLKNADSVTTADGVTTTVHDVIGRPVVRRTPLTGTDSIQYNVMNEVTRTRSGAGLVSQAGFSIATRRDSIMDPKSRWFKTDVDPLGRPIAIFDIATTPRADSLVYDGMGRVSRVRTRRGDDITMKYDRLGRDSVRIAGSDTSYFAYDDRSNGAGGPANGWLAAWNANSRDSTFLDPSGRVSRTSSVRGGTTLVVEYEYDNGAGAVRQLRWKKNGTYADTINLAYDAYNRLKGQGAPQGGQTRVTYAATGMLDSILFPSGGLKMQQTYNSVTGRVTGLQTTAADNFVNRLYGHDARGRTTVRQWGDWINGEARFMAYDSASRLVSFTDSSMVRYLDFTCYAYDWDGNCTSWGYTPRYEHTWLRGDSYSYDAVGNRTDGGDTATGPANRRPSWRGYALTYDNAGNLLTRHKTSDSLALFWNALGQLDSARRNGVVTRFKYDAYGRRIQKASGGTTTNYLLDGDVTLVELDGSMTAQRTYSYWPGTDRPHAVKTAGNVYTYLYEEPGNVVALANASGTLVNTYQYDPWGVDLGTTSSVAQPFRYTGRELDSETGLYYYRARYYDPAMARFVSEDPIGIAGGINGYAYVDNAPADLLDPTGTSGCRPTQTPGTVFGIPICWPWQTMSPVPVSATPPAQKRKEILIPDVLGEWGIGRHGLNTIGVGSTWTTKYNAEPSDAADRDADVGELAEEECHRRRSKAIVALASDVSILFGLQGASALRAAIPVRNLRVDILMANRAKRTAIAVGAGLGIGIGLTSNLLSAETFWEAVPIVGSLSAYRDMWRACMNPGGE